MIKTYLSVEGSITELAGREFPKGCWINMVAPTVEETEEIATRFQVDLNDLRAPLDEEERSRVEIEDEYMMILVDIPIVETRNDKDWYGTLPLGIFLVDDALLTICLQETSILKGFEENKVRGFSTNMRTRFIFQILYRNASLYLAFLRAVDKKSEEIENKLRESTKNNELIELLELEKSLTYFTTSLRGNEVVLERLLRTERVKKYPEDTELLEDVIIENKQAMEMANIYSGILNGMVQTFASVISNNLNIVMKLMTTLTIVMSIPTLISGLYGMNVEGIPFSTGPYAFCVVTLMALLLAGLVAIWFKKKNMF